MRLVAQSFLLQILSLFFLLFLCHGEYYYTILFLYSPSLSQSWKLLSEISFLHSLVTFSRMEVKRKGITPVFISNDLNNLILIKNGFEISPMTSTVLLSIWLMRFCVLLSTLYSSQTPNRMALSMKL